MILIFSSRPHLHDLPSKSRAAQVWHLRGEKTFCSSVTDFHFFTLGRDNFCSFCIIWAGVNHATGFPYLVITIVSPDFMRFKYASNWLLNSLILIVSSFMHEFSSISLHYIPICPFNNSSNIDSGTCTATTSPRTVRMPLARIHSSTTTLRPLSSLTLARISSSTPSGVGL